MVRLDHLDLLGKEKMGKMENLDLKEFKDLQAYRDHQGRWESQVYKEKEAKLERAKLDHRDHQETMESQEQRD